MLLVAFMLLPIAALVLTGGRFGDLVDVRVRWTPLLLATLSVAVAITTCFPGGSADAHRWINLATYAVALAVLWRNRGLPGLRLAWIGTALNVTAISANNGVMPAWRPALNVAGLPATSHAFLSSAAVAHPRLLVLGDVFAVPSWVPFANVFSVGDVLIVVGISYTILCLGDSRLVPAGIRKGHRTRLGLEPPSATDPDALPAQDDARRSIVEGEVGLAPLVAYSSDAIIVIDRDAIISRLPIGENLFGYRPEELVGMDALQLVHPEDLDFAVQELMAAIVDPGYRRTIELRIKHADGHWLPVELAATSRFDDPSVAGIIMNVRDVTERVHAAAELHASQERHRSLIADLPGAVFRCRATSPYRDEYMSNGIEDLTGYPPAEFESGARILDHLILPEHLERTDRELETAITERRAYVIEYPILHRDGVVRWLSEHGHVLYDDDGVAGLLEGVIFDMSDRVSALNEMHHSQEWLDTLIANVPGAVFRCEVAPPYSDIFTSAAIEGLVGYTQQQLVDAGMVLYDLIIPEQVPKVEALVERAIADRVPYIVEYQMRHRDGSLRWIEERGQASYTDDTAQWLDGVLFDLTQRKQLEQRLAHDATHDGLTGLPNRNLLLKHLDTTLARARRSGDPVAVLFVDLDRFKLVNDALGHAAGDELLVHFARRLSAALRASDLAARTGGDEFVIVCSDLNATGDARTEAEAIAGRIAGVLHEPFKIQGREMFVTASIGIALASPEATAADLLRDADTAVYRAKDLGRDRLEVFDQTLRAATAAALDVETDLHRALDDGQLLLRYQPVVELSTGRIVGAEGLVRWQHPDRGLLTPDQFLTAAEATGLVVGLGHQVLDLAVGALTNTSETAVPYIAINLSPRELAQPDVVERITSTLQESQVDAHRLCIEITENAVLQDVDTAIATLNALRALGVRLAIDDFGTGYSSLNYLMRLPVDIVKIDRTFINELVTVDANATVVAGIIGLAHGLGLEVIAEGVETTRQAETLSRLGCTLGQGFLYSAAVPLDELLRQKHAQTTLDPCDQPSRS